VNQWWKPAAIAAVLILGLIAGAELLRGETAKSDRPNFTAPELGGQAWNLADHRGKGPIIVNFFATWCGPCNMELPHLVQLQEKYRDRGLKVVAVTDETADQLRGHPMAQHKLIFLTDAGDVKQAYGIDAIPHTIMFTPEGKVQGEIAGFSDDAVKSLDDYLAGLPRLQAAR
jgi:thiol-disulfide isomerase/thioredoxin